MKLTKQDIRQAIWHENFRNLFPELKNEIAAIISNPGCSCNNAKFAKFFEYPDRLREYFPTKEVPKQNPECKWQVINCHVDELESKLRELGDLPKYVTVARYEDQVTAVIGEMS